MKKRAFSIPGLPLLDTPDSVLTHTVEKRGFVTVPLDYAQPKLAELRVFYRLIPKQGLRASDASAPTLVVINGGPGMASYHYRAYDYDYTRGASPSSSAADFLGELTRYFRVLILDQRGTAGNSTEIDLNDASLDPALVVKYFDSKHIALDHQQVLEAVLPGTDFFMVAQSYGGYVGMHYISLPEIHRLPKGLCFSSAGMPHSNFQRGMLQRRQKQYDLNQELQKTRPDVVALVGRLRAHLKEHGCDPGAANVLWSYLGYGETGVWQNILETKIKEQLAKQGEVLRTWVNAEVADGFLNYLLSSPMMNPGFTDATLAAQTSRQIPFEPWMLDENWVLQRIGRDGTWREALLNAFDQTPPAPTYYAPVPEIRRGLHRVRSLFSLAEGDVFLPLETVRESASPYYKEGATEEIVLPGGHKALFLEKGARAFWLWTQTLQG